MDNIKNIFVRLWSQLIEFWQNRNLVTFCLFLLFAGILWYGHALNTVRERTLKISIEYTGIADNIDFNEPLPREFRFVVRDQGKRLQKYRESNFAPIEIDLKQQFTSTEGKIHITADQVKSKIADQLQGTAKIQNIQPELIETGYFYQKKKVVPVRVCGNITPAQQYYFIQEPATIPGEITLYGKREMLDTISCVYTEQVSITDVRDSVSLDAALVLTEGIRYSHDKVHLVVQAEQFTEKTLTIGIASVGVPQGESLRLFPATTEVTVRIAVSNFSEVTEDDLKVICRYPQTERRTLPLELNYTSNNIIQARLTPSEVEYIIEKL